MSERVCVREKEREREREVPVLCNGPCWELEQERERERSLLRLTALLSTIVSREKRQ